MMPILLWSAPTRDFVTGRLENVTVSRTTMEFLVREPSVPPTVTTEESATPRNSSLMKLGEIMTAHGMPSSMLDASVIWGTEDQTAHCKSVLLDLMSSLEKVTRLGEIAQGEEFVITTEVSASASLGTLEPDVNIRPSLDKSKHVF